MSENELPPKRGSNIVIVRHDEMKKVHRRLPDFIGDNIEPIVSEWQEFARSLTPSSAGMTPLALRDHIHQILAFLVLDMKSPQTPGEQNVKSHGDKKQIQPVTAAQTHAALRFAGGFDIGQMVSEYRALRARRVLT